MKVYVVLRTGPEWNDIIDIYSDRRTAVLKAADLQKNRNMKDVFESLSSYKVITYTVKENGQ